MTGEPEFSRIFKTSELGDRVQTGSLAANESECAALAKRFDLPDIASLSAEYRLENAGDYIRFEGSLHSDVQQNCVISGEPFPVRIEEEFVIRFVAKSSASELEDEVELQSGECDEIEFDGAKLDLGEALAQTLYLSLDQYPRGPDADRISEEKGLQDEGSEGPFAALAALKGEES